MKRLSIPAEPADWAAEARTIGNALASMHSGPPAPGTPKAGTNILLAILNGETLEKWPLRFATAKTVLRLQDKIGWHLSYRLREHHKVRPRREDRQTGLRFIARLNPERVIAYIDELETQGVRFAGSDAWAVRAYLMLGQVLIDRFASDEWKRALPLAVASIGGESVSRAAIRKAKKLRGGRPNSLREKKLAVLANNSSLSWKQVLYVLKDGPDADNRIVKNWTDRVITWVDPNDDEPKQTSVGTFRNWKPDP